MTNKNQMEENFLWWFLFIKFINDTFYQSPQNILFYSHISKFHFNSCLLNKWIVFDQLRFGSNKALVTIGQSCGTMDIMFGLRTVWINTGWCSYSSGPKLQLRPNNSLNLKMYSGVWTSTHTPIWSHPELGPFKK